MGYEKVSRPTRPLAGSPSRIGRKSIVAGVVAAAAAGAASPAFADIELGEGLSVSGFVDMSLFSQEDDGGPAHFNIDQVETQFKYSFSDGISAEVDIEYGRSASIFDGGEGLNDHTFVEQAFVTKQFTDNFSMKVGRFLSYSGWETEEPTGLFQYSAVGYAPLFYGYYQQGVSAMYSTGKFALMGSVVNSAFDPNETETGDLGYELGAAIMPIEGLTAKLFYIVNSYDGVSDDDKLINFWVSYAMGGFTFAGEYNTAKYAGGPGEADGFLLMANYATGPYGVTVRYGDVDVEGGAQSNSITFSPSYKVSDNLLLVAEYRKDKIDGPPANPSSFALEALFTF